ncbi:MAG: copper resistance protein CopC [Mycobacteriales bacterium]
MSRRFGLRPVPAGGRVVAAVVLAAMSALLVALAPPAAAHSVLIASAPTGGAALSTPPAEVRLDFAGPVEISLSAIEVREASGRRVDVGRLRAAEESATKVAVDLEDSLPPGKYQVRWRAASTDGHPSTGRFSFAVDTGGAGSSDRGPGGHRWVGLLLAVMRLGVFVGMSLGPGIALVQAWIPLTAAADPATRQVARAGAHALLAASLGCFLLAAPYAAGLGLAAVGRPALIGAVLTTRYGVASLTTLLLAAAFLWLPGRRDGGTPSSRLVVCVFAGLATSIAAAGGHAGRGDQAAGTLVALGVHVAAMAAWLGGLVLFALLATRRRAFPQLVVALGRFSRLSTLAVALLVATGSYDAWRAGALSRGLTATAYGRVLVVKVVVVLGLVAVGYLARRWLRAAARSVALVPVLRRRLVVEATLGVGVLMLTAVLVVLAQPREAYLPPYDQTVGPLAVHISPGLAGSRQQTVTVAAVDGSAAPPLVGLTASVTVPRDGVGPLPVAFRSMSGNRATARIRVPAAGAWVLEIKLTGPTGMTSYSVPFLAR